MRVDIGNGESIPTRREDIRVGDWISAPRMGMGKVKAIGSIPFGKKRIHGFLITTAKGTTDFVDEESAAILGYVDCTPPRSEVT